MIVGLVLLLLSFNAYAESDFAQPDLIHCLGIKEPVEVKEISPVLRQLECMEKRNVIAEGLKNRKPSKQVLQELATKRPDVWLFGEIHTDKHLAIQPEIIRKVKEVDPRVDCLFAEFVPGKERYWTDVNELRKWKDPYTPVAMTAKRLGMNIVFVDRYKNAYIGDDNYTNKQFAYNVHSRNKGMADEIKKAFVSGKCHAGVYIVGSAHLLSSEDHFLIDSLQHFMDELKLSSVSVNLHVVSEKSDELLKESCQDDLPTSIQTQSGFLHRKSEIRAPLYKWGGFYNDFDATILIP